MTFKINNENIADLRTSPKVYAMLEDRAKTAVNVLSEGGRVEGYFYRLQYARRNRAAVAISGWGHAKNSNKKHDSLLRVLDTVSDDIAKGRRR